MREKLRTVLQIIIGNCNCFRIIAHFDLSGGTDDICGYGRVRPGKEQCISISEIMIFSFHMIYQIFELLWHIHLAIRNTYEFLWNIYEYLWAYYIALMAL